jgi:hypothetical protein
MSTTSAAPTAPVTGAVPARTTSYATLLPAVLVAAFTLSAVHTVHSDLTGIADPGWGIGDPVVWAFYAVAFGVAALSRSGHRAAQAAVLAYLAVLLGVSVFVYPSMFGPEQQTVFGWFENDVYVGLLMVATFLGVLRVRRVAVVR